MYFITHNNATILGGCSYRETTMKINRVSHTSRLHVLHVRKSYQTNQKYDRTTHHFKLSSLIITDTDKLIINLAINLLFWWIFWHQRLQSLMLMKEISDEVHAWMVRCDRIGFRTVYPQAIWIYLNYRTKRLTVSWHASII